jgi:hypothetical protein
MKIADAVTQCPSCGADIIWEYDFDDGQIWVRQVWRECECGVTLEEPKLEELDGRAAQ